MKSIDYNVSPLCFINVAQDKHLTAFKLYSIPGRKPIDYEGFSGSLEHQDALLYFDLGTYSLQTRVQTLSNTTKCVFQKTHNKYSVVGIPIKGFLKYRYIRKGFFNKT